MARVTHLADLMHRAEASNGTAIPSNWILSTDGTKALAWRPETTSSGSVSYGSNATHVSDSSDGGAAANASRSDHRHLGVRSLSHASNTMFGDITLQTEGSLYIVKPAPGILKFGSTGGSGGGGSSGVTVQPDPVALMLGTPDTAFEFATSSMTGLTTMGSPDTMDADTTVPDHLFIRKAATSSVSLTGAYAAVTAPFTVVTKLTAHNVFGSNYTRVGGLFIGTATPGRVDAIHVLYANGFFASVVAYTNPTTFSATINVDLIVGPDLPIYYAIVATTTTNVAFYYSFDGYLWTLREGGRDPSITIGSAGVLVDPEQAVRAVTGAYEYLRIWNSALTLKGV